MSSTNQSPEYTKAQGEYLKAQNNEDRLKWLEVMIRECPKHKGAEKMLSNLKTRAIALREKIERIKKSSKGGKKVGIKKEDMQAVIIGFTSSGKSSLISALTNTKPEIAPYKFTTKTPVIGMMPFTGSLVQLIEIPAIESEYYDRGFVNSADTVLVLVNKIEDITKILSIIEHYSSHKIIVFNNKDNLDERKLESTLKSKKINYVIINTENKQGLPELKEKIFKSFGKLRVYTKEPGKPKSDKPIIMDPESTVKDVAEKIFHGFSKQVTDSFITGPSSKFPNQRVGLAHKIKDMDIIEFKTR